MNRNWRRYRRGFPRLPSASSPSAQCKILDHVEKSDLSHLVLLVLKGSICQFYSRDQLKVGGPSGCL
ncbi:hypothetical protein PAPYR_2709 [Paratrimastix pyriformis]|uniref:Uncharacterized protein n=1 Tax=Paratrimastix pyriformis TaxID=342808 RepID=A0ABQ8UNW6_9EUKA|nr:hypothetical protein PAPYR_2709 [Paratrimastix pyriformis]